MMKQELKPRYDIINAWQKYRPSIEESLAKMGGMFTHEDILKKILNHEMHWWEKDGTFAITEFDVYPQTKYLNIFLVGGNMAGVEVMEKELAKFAKIAECEKMVAFLRKGFLTKRDIFPGWEMVNSPIRAERDV